MGATDYVMLRKLTVQEGEPIDGILQRACNELRGLGEKALLQLRLIGTGSTDAGGNYSARLTPAGTFAHADSTTRPTLAIITTTDVFRRLANGTYSPVQAYLDGDLRLHGNVDVAKRMLLHLAGSGTQVTVCPLLTNESWRLDGPGIGSLTVTGKFFTPSGM